MHLVVTVATLVAVVVAVSATCRRFDLSAPLVLVALGMVASFIPWIPDVRMTADLALVGFLPPLLYAAALQTSLVDFNANRRPILLLSIGLVAFTTVVVAVVVHEVIPGIASFQVLAAKHRLPLNEIGEPVVITTGRRLAEDGISEGSGNAVVMLDGQCAFQTVPAADYEIFWGAYLGMKTEVLRSGPLADVADDIVKTRDAARAANGWIMDTYLLRRIRRD